MDTLVGRVPPGDPWKIRKPTFASTPETPLEQKFITDDVKFFAELIASHWSLGLDEEVNIAYVPEASITDGRVGYIYVYMIARPIDQTASIDYRTVKRTCRIGFKIANRYRDRNMMWTEEVTRILLDWRRAGQHKLQGWSYFELSGDSQMNNLTGWYTDTVEIKLTKYNQGIISPGFGSAEIHTPLARDIPHQTIGMRPFDIENSQTGVIRVGGTRTVTHPAVTPDPDQDNTEITIAHEFGDDPTDTVKPHDTVRVTVEKREETVHTHDTVETAYSKTEKRAAAPEWENRMFAPAVKKEE